ncbi:MAG: CDF family Co(II)/Ni(II) efflux transporter DmeF, partial [Chloroflexi bacterium]|nr:CDF family Co(II)/Ni(II) efflux transporter DmeF [Chloroflexota bacterium]
MDTDWLQLYRHTHVFGQDRIQAGERRTGWVLALTGTTMVVEIAAGIAFGSMALLADGLHMGSHATALGIAVFAYRYARRHAHNRDFTFGTGKVNALAGFSSAILLVVFALMMAWESVQRFVHPVDIRFDQAIVVAVIGLAVNAVSALVLAGRSHGEHDHDHHHDHDQGHAQHTHAHTDHNLRAAYLHVLADALTSLLAIFALLAGKLAGLG